MKVISLQRNILQLFLLLRFLPFASGGGNVTEQASFHSKHSIEDTESPATLDCVVIHNSSATESTLAPKDNQATSESLLAVPLNGLSLPGKVLSSSTGLIDSTEASRILVNPSSQWIQTGLDLDGEAPEEYSGYSVALGGANGDILVVGAPGSRAGGIESGQTRVYQSIGGFFWTQLGDAINGENAGDNSGRAVDISRDGTRIAIGAIFNDGNGFMSGHVRIFRWSGLEWDQLGDSIEGEAAGDLGGSSLSLSGDGNRIAVGAPGNDSSNGYYNGHVRVFEWDGSSWAQLGTDIDGLAESDTFGTSVSISFDGSRLAVGADGNDHNGWNSGHVRIFEYVEYSWVQLGSDIHGSAEGDRFGTSVSIADDGKLVACGAPNSLKGYARVYAWNGSIWVKVGEDIVGEDAGDQFGTSVSLSNWRIAVGGRFNHGDNGYYKGHVRVFNFVDNSWQQIGADIDGEGDSDISGNSVALFSGDRGRVAIGAPFNGDGGANSGHVRVFDLLEDTQDPDDPDDNDDDNGIGGGDPHFKTFNGHYFSFHGQCDLVLMNSYGFASGLGARVHVRTTRVDKTWGSFSYISNAAVMIGKEVLEVSQHGILYVNSKRTNENVSTFAGYTLSKITKGTKKRILVFSLDLLGGKYIKIHVNLFEEMVFVKMSGKFDDSEGLLGANRRMNGNALLSREGVDLYGYWNSYAEDWQVRSDEPRLFQDKNRSPQFPDSCVYKSKKKKQNLRRRLLIDNRVNIEDATRACADVNKQMRDFCIFDVMARSDIDLALDPFYN